MSEESTLTAPVTRVITRDQAEEWDLHYAAPGQIAVERLDEHRWYVVKRVIFTAPDDGLIWAAEYNHPLTEVQDGQDPWDGRQEITLTRFESYEKTVTAWRPAAATGQPS
jgi:hypothetical protein